MTVFEIKRLIYPSCCVIITTYFDSHARNGREISLEKCSPEKRERMQNGRQGACSGIKKTINIGVYV